MDRTSGLGFVLDVNGSRVFVDQDLAGGIDGTDVEQVWLTGVQEELCGIILAAGLVLSATNNAQLIAALRLLFDATASYPSANNGIVTLPGGIILQSSAAIVTAGGGYNTTVVTLPVAFPNNIFDAQICFLGNTPPAGGGSIAVQIVSKSQIAVTTNYATAGTLGVAITTKGN